MGFDKYKKAYDRIAEYCFKNAKIEDIYKDLNLIGELVELAEVLEHKNAKLNGRVGGLQREIEKLRSRR